MFKSMRLMTDASTCELGRQCTDEDNTSFADETSTRANHNSIIAADGMPLSAKTYTGHRKLASEFQKSKNIELKFPSSYADGILLELNRGTKPQDKTE